MPKWILPAAVLGVGGVGVLLLTDRGRNMIRWTIDQIDSAPDHFQDWNERAQQELARIQDALDRVAATLEAAR